MCSKMKAHGEKWPNTGVVDSDCGLPHGSGDWQFGESGYELKCPVWLQILNLENDPRLYYRYIRLLVYN